jgi:hypothetical protein
MADGGWDLVVEPVTSKRLDMALLILLALLLALDLVAWRWGTTPATAATGDLDNGAGSAATEGELMLRSLSRFAGRRRRWVLAGTLLATEPAVRQPSFHWTRGSAPLLAATTGINRLVSSRPGGAARSGMKIGRVAR